MNPAYLSAVASAVRLEREGLQLAAMDTIWCVFDDALHAGQHADVNECLLELAHRIVARRDPCGHRDESLFQVALTLWTVTAPARGDLSAWALYTLACRDASLDVDADWPACFEVVGEGPPVLTEDDLLTIRRETSGMREWLTQRLTRTDAPDTVRMSSAT